MVREVVLDTNILMATEDYEAMLRELDADKYTIPFEALSELDGLKGATGNKGYQARRAIRKIEPSSDRFSFAMADPENLLPKVDSKLIEYCKENDAKLITNDIAMKLQASAVGVEVSSYYEIKDVGRGWHRYELANHDGGVIASGQALREAMNGGRIKIGEYLILYEYGFPIEAFVREEKSFRKVQDFAITSGHSGQIKPKDEYQSCAFDALKRSEFTILTGRAGSGKTLLSVSRMLEALSNGEVGKIVIFTNPTKARGSEELGFYKGDRNAKLLQNSIGAILVSKLGSLFLLEEMLENETLVIMPMSDIRGYEVPEDAYLYISEAQNASVDLLQLAIQRASGGPIILEGDPFTQLDHWSFGGENNGMLKAIEVFKEFPGFSHVDLPNIYRSDIADRAALMTENL